MMFSSGITIAPATRTEYEIVYITGANGTRHVGDHISRYEGSDLVFIGPNIPHLNFDYGVKTDHRKVVVQLKESFLGDQLWTAPEFSAIARLFELARTGVSFHGETKRIIGERLETLGLRLLSAGISNG